MTVSERIPFSGLLLPLQKGYTYVFASFNSIMVGVLMVAIAVYVCVAAEYEPRSVGAGGHVLLRHEAHHSRCGHRGALILALRRHVHLPDRR